jgi:hypothetical protein
VSEDISHTLLRQMINLPDGNGPDDLSDVIEISLRQIRFKFNTIVQQYRIEELHEAPGPGPVYVPTHPLSQQISPAATRVRREARKPKSELKVYITVDPPFCVLSPPPRNSIEKISATQRT